MFGRRRWIVLLAVGITVLSGASAALAGVGVSAGGDQVSVSVSTSTSLPGSDVHSGSSLGADGGGSAPPCTYTPVVVSNPSPWVPPGPGGTLYVVACPGSSDGMNGFALQWVPAGSPTPPAAGSAVAPSAVALQAERTLTVPSPTIALNPDAAHGVVMLPTWLWVQPGVWHPLSATAVAGTLSATVTVTPTKVTWNMGDGDTVVCDGPGTAFRADLPAEAQASACSYTYHRSSLGQPTPDGNPDHGAYVVTAAISWTVSWTASDGASGILPPLVSTSSSDVRVQQIQSVDVAG